MKKSLQERIEDISALIFEVANGNFDYTIEAAGEDDELDAIISGVNMLGQELKISTVSKDHVQSMYDGVIDPIVVMDLNMNVQKVNGAFTQALGISEGEAKGKYLVELIDLEKTAHDIAEISNQMQQDGKYQNAELYFKTKDDDTLPTSASFSYLKNANNEHEGIMIVAKDITQIKETEKKLIEAKEAAEEANMAKGRFLSNMSHEIRTPLNGIIGFTDLLKTTETDDAQSEYIEMISNASTNLAKLLNDVLDLNKIDLDRIELEEIPYDFRATFTSNLNPYTYTAKDKGIELTYSFDESVPKIVVGDPTRLNQVLVNLVGNAIKFTQIGFVDITFSSVKKGEEMFLQCEVADTGIGIPADKQDTIFDTFTQSDNTITRKFGGSGLGLAICKQLVEVMGGEIEVISPSISRSHGTIFKFTIPVKEGKEEVNHKSGSDSESDQFENLKVLAVDDNNVNLILIKRILEKSGIEVATAINGKEAIQKSKREPFNLVLMDIQMPVMDGLTATKLLRKEGYESPILALSANVDKENIKAIKESGMDDFLQKPFRKPQLIQLLKKWSEAN
ncbi:MAG: response regulator [Ekhidna sp.]